MTRRPAASRNSPVSERRQVTALMCDLVDSVSLTVRLDPEDMLNVIDIFLSTCTRVIGELGGHITQFQGDGVLAYFGYPRADEDAPANAVHAGLALRAAVQRLDLPLDVTLRMRVGIATGLVVVGDLIGRGMGRTADLVGETPNLAARLQSIAPPNGVVVAKATQSITSGHFVYRDLGMFTLKGFASPIQAFEAVETTPLASRFLTRTRGRTTPLVGREDELDLLRDHWASARVGDGRIVLLRGEPGIGKSRLVEELRAYAADIPHQQMIWFCGPNTTDSALYPISQQLTRLAGFERGDSQAACREKLTRLLAQFEVTAPASQAVIADLAGVVLDASPAIDTMTPDKRKEVILETLIEMIEHRAGTGPALIGTRGCPLGGCDNARAA